MDKIYVWVKRRKLKPKRGLKQGCSYMVQWQDPKTGKTKSESCGKDKALAYRLAAERRDELQTGQYRGITVIDYDGFVSEHLEQLKGTLSKGSYIEHERTLRQFKTACHPKNLTVIDYQMIEKFRLTRITDGISAATVNKCLRTLQSALERAVKRSYIKENPFTGNRNELMVKEPKREPGVMEHEDFKRLYDACTNDRWKAIVTIGYYAGLRRGEILALEWGDIDFNKKMLHIRNKDDHATKTRNYREVPMHSEVISGLQVLRYGMMRGNLIFMNVNGRKMINNFDRKYTEISTQAELVDENGNPLFTMQDLRSTCATNLLESGADPKTVQDIMGHSNITTTMKHYAGVRAKNRIAAIDRLGKGATQTA